ncbi:MAG: hypothetical protein ACREP9_22705 [Candidatus Dormibacteraceae bacterium]
MASAIFFAMTGILLLILGGFGLRFLDHAPVKNIQLVYTLLAVGALFAGLAIWVVISRFRYYGNLRSYPDRGGSSGSYTGGSDLGYGAGGDCGHPPGGGEGGCGGDGGGGH